MAGSDDEFDEFLRRRAPKFRSPDDMFEPPAELDRVVLRQAREAIESERPMRVFRNPRWATPVALAATLVLAFTVMFYAGLPQKHTPVPEVTVQNVAERVEIPAAAAPTESAPAAQTYNPANNQAREDHSSGDAVVVDMNAPMMARIEPVAGAAPPPNAGLVSHEEAERYAPPPSPAAPMVAPTIDRRTAESGSRERAMASTAADGSTVVITTPPATSTEIPTWRRDPKTWKAEIERLRNAGDFARADAELAEFNRQQRAYAVGPDR